MAFPRIVCALPFAAVLTSCTVAPRTVESFDYECKTYQRSATLTAKPIGGLDKSCQQQPGLCLPLLVGAGAVTAATTIISGSLVITGNVVFWLERQSRCNPNNGSARPAQTPAARPVEEALN
jgi:hypothetical protein